MSPGTLVTFKPGPYTITTVGCIAKVLPSPSVKKQGATYVKVLHINPEHPRYNTEVASDVLNHCYWVKNQFITPYRIHIHKGLNICQTIAYQELGSNHMDQVTQPRNLADSSTSNDSELEDLPSWLSEGISSSIGESLIQSMINAHTSTLSQPSELQHVSSRPLIISTPLGSLSQSI